MFRFYCSFHCDIQGELSILIGWEKSSFLSERRHYFFERQQRKQIIIQETEPAIKWQGLNSPKVFALLAREEFAKRSGAPLNGLSLRSIPGCVLLRSDSRYDKVKPSTRERSGKRSTLWCNLIIPSSVTLKTLLSLKGLRFWRDKPTRRHGNVNFVGCNEIPHNKVYII